MEDSPRHSARGRPWFFLAALGLAAVALAVLVSAWWYNSDGDLVAVRAEAKTAGVPTTWKEAGLALSPIDEIDRKNRLGKLIGSLKNYDSSRTPAHGATKPPPSLKSFLPIPPEAIAHHAALDPLILKQLSDEIDLLPDHPIILRTESDVLTHRMEYAQLRNITRLLGERVMLAADTDVVAESHRLLHLFLSSNPRNFIDLLMHVGSLTSAITSISARFPDLRTRDPELADRLARIAKELDQHLIQSLEGSFIETFDATERLPKSFLSFAPSTWEDVLVHPRVRCGRYLLLHMHLEWIALAKHQTSPSDLVRISRTIDAHLDGLRAWWPSESLAKQFDTAHMAFEFTATTQVVLHLLIAELRGQPWPIDPFDPAGHPLRRVERDGNLMGAYSVHRNSRDDSGKHGDRYFPLYGPLAPPEPTITP